MGQPSLGSLIDKLYTTRAARLELDKKSDEMRAVEKELATQITSLLNTAGLEKASGGIATASLGDKVVHNVEDWDAARAWMIEQIPEDKLEAACVDFGRAVANKRRAKAFEHLKRVLTESIAWELLQKRISSTVAEERFEQGEQIPGTKRFVERTVTSLVKR